MDTIIVTLQPLADAKKPVQAKICLFPCSWCQDAEGKHPLEAEIGNNNCYVSFDHILAGKETLIYAGKCFGRELLYQLSQEDAIKVREAFFKANEGLSPDMDIFLIQHLFGFEKLNKQEVTTMTFKTKSGILFANDYIRVVIGGQGTYIEFEQKQIVVELETEPGQEYRGVGKYTNCKYFWLRPLGDSSMKVYLQRGLVSYADYKVGKYYVSPDQLDWDGSSLYAEQSNFPNPTSINKGWWRKT